MADTHTGADTATQNAGAVDEGNEGSPTTNTSQGDDAQSTDGDDDTNDEDEGDKDNPDDGVEPPVRRSKDYFIGLRHGKKAAREAAEARGQENNGDDGVHDTDDSGADDGDIDGKVQKALEPFAKEFSAQERTSELTTFFAQHPEFKSDKQKIERFARHQSREHLPIMTIAMEVVGAEGMMRIGAKMARTADAKKRTSQSSGNASRASSAAQRSAWEMSDSEFHDAQEAVRRKAR